MLSNTHFASLPTGQLLPSLKRLLRQLTQLRTLRLVDLQLERYDANHLLDELVQTTSPACGQTLHTLHLINMTACHCPCLHVGLFFNLRVLVISPQSVDDDVLTLLADSRVCHLHLLQTSYTPDSCALSACSARAWQMVRRDNATMRVHLCIESTHGTGEVLLQPEAPVYSILYRTANTQLVAERVARAAQCYGRTLRVYGHEGLPRHGVLAGFAGRADRQLVGLVEKCRGLKTLVS